jgi:putative ABC transport system substrate-binding protein
VELTGKRMELLRLLFPERDSILVFYDPRLQASLLALQKARETAALHSWQIEPVPVKNDSDIQSLHDRSFGDKESILILSSYYLESKFREIRDLSFQKKIPVMGLHESETLAGYTASYGISNFDQGKQSARLVIRALDRQNPGNLLFEMPDVVRLKLNMQAAAKLGVHFSPLGLTYGEKISEIRE